MRQKFTQRPMRKKPNITLETTRTRVRIVVTWAGRAIVAPKRSSLRIMATGLNHQRFWGLEQWVMPL